MELIDKSMKARKNMAELEKIIIIDEVDAQVLFWEMLLPEFNLQIIKCRAGAEAVDLIAKENISYAVMSWDLTSMPSAVVLQKVKMNRKRSWMPFLIYSTRIGAEDQALLSELGLNNICGIPLDKEKARAQISNIMQAAQNITPLEKKIRIMQVYLEQNKPTEVLKMATAEFNKKGPHLVKYKNILAETFLKIGNIEKAKKANEESLAIDDKYLPSLYLKSRIHTIEGNHDAALEIVRILAEKSPKNIESLVALGSAYVSADKIEEAKEVVHKISELDEENVAVKETNGKIAIKEGNLELAAQLLSDTQNGDEIARFYNSLGISYVAKGEYDKGIATYQSAMKVLSNKSKLHMLNFNLALAYRKKGNTLEEASCLLDCYAAEPAFEKAYASLARCSQEAKAKGLSLDPSKLRNVVKARQEFLAKHPKIAKAIQDRMAKAAK